MHKVVASECCSRGTNFTERIGKSKDQQTSGLKQEIALLQRRTPYPGEESGIKLRQKVVKTLHMECKKHYP